MEESDLKFGDWRLDPHGNQLSNGQHSSRLEPKPLLLLIYMLAHAGELLKKENLLAEIWVGRVVNEDVISVAISQLRKAFQDDARKPAYIKTMPGAGYQFIFPLNNTEKKNARNYLRVLQGSEKERTALSLEDYLTNIKHIPSKLFLLFAGFTVLQVLIVFMTISFLQC